MVFSYYWQHLFNR